MVTRGISRGARKPTRTPSLSKKKTKKKTKKKKDQMIVELLTQAIGLFQWTGWLLVVLKISLFLVKR